MPRLLLVAFAIPLLMSLPLRGSLADATGKATLVGGAVLGQGSPSAEVLAVAEAERAFAKLAAEKGVKEAFVATAAADGILLRPRPVNAKEFMGARPSNAGPLLAWGPSYVELSASGDLAWDTGPWNFSPDRTKPAVAWGHFATVWRKDPDGVWRWIIDHGHDMPAAEAEAPLAWGRSSVPGNGPKIAADTKPGAESPHAAGLTAADRGYEEALAQGGLAQALAKYGASDVRIYREGHVPVVGAAALAAFPNEWKGGVRTAEPHTGQISRAGDLGYTYGTITPADTSLSKLGRNYVRVWRNDGTSGWRVALDIVNEIPPPPAPPPPPPAK